MTLNRHTIWFYVIMPVLQTGVARVKIEVNARFLCVKVGVAILPKWTVNSDPWQVQTTAVIVSRNHELHERENQDENKTLSLQAILYMGFFINFGSSGK